MTTATFEQAGYASVCQDSWQLRPEILQWRDVSVNPASVMQIDSNRSSCGAKGWNSEQSQRPGNIVEDFFFIHLFVYLFTFVELWWKQ